jgi:hypothetical protein
LIEAVKGAPLARRLRRSPTLDSLDQSECFATKRSTANCGGWSAAPWDHRHFADREESFVFSSIEELLARFTAEVEEMRKPE